jgi:hypothetical protein
MKVKIQKVAEVRRCYGMEMNVEKYLDNENLNATIHSTNYDG